MAMWRPQTAEEPPAAHAKERCPGCGLWKDKQRECLHCASRPNRMQVTSAIMTSIDDVVGSPQPLVAVTSPPNATASPVKLPTA